MVKSVGTSGGFLLRLRGADQLTQWAVDELTLVHSLPMAMGPVPSTTEASIAEASGAAPADVTSTFDVDNSDNVYSRQSSGDESDSSETDSESTATLARDPVVNEPAVKEPDIPTGGTMVRQEGLNSLVKF